MGMPATVGVVGIGVGVQVSRTMSAPITRLAEAAQRIGVGELQIRISVGGSRELLVSLANETLLVFAPLAEEQGVGLDGRRDRVLRTLQHTPGCPPGVCWLAFARSPNRVFQRIIQVAVQAEGGAATNQRCRSLRCSSPSGMSLTATVRF